MDYLSERDRSKVAENFNAMNTIINSTFKEKIDYQRKLREQQVQVLLVVVCKFLVVDLL